MDVKMDNKLEKMKTPNLLLTLDCSLENLTRDMELNAIQKQQYDNCQEAHCKRL